MLSPNVFGAKSPAASTWSLDSGYSSTSLCEEEAGLVQAMQPTASATNTFNLPEIKKGPCIECEFWKIANPGVKCETCRLPEIVEPFSTMQSSNTRALPQLDIPVQVHAAQVELLQDSEQHPDSRPQPAGTVSRCSACELSALIDPSKTTLCPSCTFDPSHLSPVSPQSSTYRVKRSRAGRNSKLPLEALNRLQAWLDANQHNPYPDAQTKRTLAQQCGITEKQVTTWFTNARARQLSPLDTYLSSSSDDEGVRNSDIGEATGTSIQTAGFTYMPETRARATIPRAASVSEASAFSSGPRTSRRGKKKDYRRNANPEVPQSPLLLSPESVISPVDGQNEHETWQCTFCRKPMVPKSWRRHEETQHRPKAQWTCMLYGPRLSLPARSNSSSSSFACAFCMMKNPSEDHFLTHHRIEDCAKRDIVDRTFFRPDHLRQHVKNFHNASLFELAQARWKKAAETIPEGWTCGFCGERLDTWDKRETHIANHFKDGLTMASWNDYLENAPKSNRKSKATEKPERRHNLSGLERLSRHAFPRRTTRSSQSQIQQQQQQQQQQVLPQQSHTNPPSQPDQSSFANAWDQIPPSSLGLGITQPQQAPVLPDLAFSGSLTLDCGSYDWTLPVSTDTGIQFTLSHGTGLYDTSGQYDSAAMGIVDLYGNEIDYQATWAGMGAQGPGGQQQQHQHQH